MRRDPAAAHPGRLPPGARGLRDTGMDVEAGVVRVRGVAGVRAARDQEAQGSPSEPGWLVCLRDESGAAIVRQMAMQGANPGESPIPLTGGESR